MNDELDRILNDINLNIDHVRERLKVISTGVFLVFIIALIALFHFW